MQQTFVIMMLFVALCLVSPILGAQEPPDSQTLLVEIANTQAAIVAASQPVTAGEISFRLEPLLGHNSRFQKNWFIARPTRATNMSAWDLAHYLVKNNSAVIYAEPDLAYIATYEPQPPAKAENCEEGGYSNDWPHPATVRFCWHLDDGYSQLRAARQEDGTNKVRIAHLDTGYDPNNISLPKYIRLDLQHNFVAGENPNSAVDLGSEGLLKQPGHGTSTLATLAGNKVKRSEYNFHDYIGGAPFAEIVPIRLSRSVILFQSSAFAKALYYVLEPDTRCEVLSMSMGGVASKLWADAVNDAYDNGLVMVTAAGNNFGTLPITDVVFPARFRRVIAACGVVYDYTPYFKYGLGEFKMQGNYGPPECMTAAIGAYTPNITWAKMGCTDRFDQSGGGTSAATPQVAAAAALWLQKYRHQSYDHPWQKVNAVRYALFSSAQKDGIKEWKKYYGNGILKAKDALNVPPKLDTQPVEKAVVRFPIWELLFGSRTEITNAARQMFEVEFLRLEHNSPLLQKLFAEIAAQEQVTVEQKARIKEIISQTPQASQAIVQIVNAM